MKDLSTSVTMEEKKGQLKSLKKKKHILLVVSVVFTLGFVLTVKYADFIEHSVAQGMFLTIGYIFVSWISEVEKKLKLLKNQIR